MYLRQLIYIALFSAVLVSCQKQLIERKPDGQLALSVENSSVIDNVTKSGDEDVNTADFTVYIMSSDGTHSESDTYANYQEKGTVTVPAGLYTVSAENMTDKDAHPKQPLGWGATRYYGISEEKEVIAGEDPTPFEVKCRMVNTAVSVVFDTSVEELFEDYQVVAYVEEDRKLTYDESTTSIGYFGSHKTLHYVFSGIYSQDSQKKTLVGKFEDIAPATHFHLTFKIKEQSGGGEGGDDGQENGGLDLSIDVIPDCDDLYANITFDPSDGSVVIDNILENGDPETK